MIDFKEIKFKDYKTVTFRGVDIDVSVELVRDVHSGTQPLSLLERIITQEYNRLVPIIRNQKIDLLLNELNR